MRRRHLRRKPQRKSHLRMSHQPKRRMNNKLLLKKRMRKLQLMTRFHSLKRSKRTQSILRLEGLKTKNLLLILTVMKSRTTKLPMLIQMLLSLEHLKKLLRTG